MEAGVQSHAPAAAAIRRGLVETQNRVGILVTRKTSASAENRTATVRSSSLQPNIYTNSIMSPIQRR
jgi:hypothetical protein